MYGYVRRKKFLLWHIRKKENKPGLKSFGFIEAKDHT